MFQDMQITCLSCSKVMKGVSVSSLPMNPYMKPRDSILTQFPSHTRDVFYSDSDEEETCEGGGVTSLDMKKNWLESEKRNRRTVDSIIENNKQRIQDLKEERKLKNDHLKETIAALESLKLKLEDEVKSNRYLAKVNINQENKNNSLRQQFDNADKLDFKTIKTIHEEASNIKKMLNSEIDFSNAQKLENAISKSTVRIDFDKADPLLVKLKVEHDKILLKLSAQYEEDSDLILLSAFLLKKIFSERIAAHNENFKKLSESEADSPTKKYEVDQTYLVRNGTDEISNNFEIKNITSAPNASEWSSIETSKVNNNPGKVVASSVPSATPMSFSDMAKKQANPGAAVLKKIPFPEKFARSNRPHCFFKIQVDNEAPFRVVFELRPDMAPQMVDNFVKLCEGLPDGRGYKGSKIFRAKPDDHISGGDFENNDGTGGHSAFQEKLVMAEQCPLRDHKWAIRMKGQDRQTDGRCKIGSQFMIWLGDIEYKEYRFTLVFGKVVEGFKHLLEVSRIKGVQKSSESWVLKQSVKIVDSGVI